MQRLLTCLLLTLVLTMGSAAAQPWVQDHLSHERLGAPDSLVAFFRGEMHKVVGKPAPRLAFVPLGERRPHSLASLKGTPTIIMFWRTTCSGCHMQMPELSRLYRKYADQGLNVVYVGAEPAARLRAFPAKHKIRGTVARTNWNKLQWPYQLIATPSAFLVDRSGRIREAWIRPKEFEALDRLTAPYLTEQ